MGCGLVTGEESGTLTPARQPAWACRGAAGTPACAASCARFIASHRPQLVTSQPSRRRVRPNPPVITRHVRSLPSRPHHRGCRARCIPTQAVSARVTRQHCPACCGLRLSARLVCTRWFDRRMVTRNSTGRPCQRPSTAVNGAVNDSRRVPPKRVRHVGTAALVSADPGQYWGDVALQGRHCPRRS